MSRHGDITLGWADGEYLFRLAWAQLAALQEAVDAGPQHVLDRLLQRHWRVQDVEQVILLGLIGGGMEPARARGLVKTWVHDQPFAENLLVAQAVLSAAIVGAPDDPPPELPEKPAAATGTDSPPCPEGS